MSRVSSYRNDDLPFSFCTLCHFTHEFGRCLYQYNSLRDPFLRGHVSRRRQFFQRKGLIDKAGRPLSEEEFNQNQREQERKRTAEEKSANEAIRRSLKVEEWRTHLLNKQREQVRVRRKAEKIRQWHRSRSSSLTSLYSPEKSRTANVNPGPPKHKRTKAKSSPSKSTFLPMIGQPVRSTMKFKYSGKEGGNLIVYQRVGMTMESLILKSSIESEGTFSVELKDIPTHGAPIVLSFYIRNYMRGAVRFCCLAGKEDWLLDSEHFTLTKRTTQGGKPCRRCGRDPSKDNLPRIPQGRPS